MQDVVELGSQEEIPDYIKSVPFPVGLRKINFQHLTEDHSLFLIGENGYYFVSFDKESK